jgi:quercetin dioxygenase-like cupin family protein
MAQVGDVIENPAMGGRLHFRRLGTAVGELLEFDFFLRPGGVIAVEHLHPHQEERFEVISGAVQGEVDGEPQTVVAGGTSIVPAGVPHAWWNAADGETHLRVQFRPALRTASLFEAAFALARDGRTNDSGVPRFPERLAFLAAFPDEMRPAGMPARVQSLLVFALMPFGRRLRRRWAPKPTQTPGELTCPYA